MLRFLRRQKKLKVLVVGFDCAPPAVLFKTGDESNLGLKDQLPNVSRLIGEGIHGPLSSSIPCITVPAWASMLTSKDPGMLGFYGFRNRADHSYDRMSIATGNAIHEPRVWDVLSGADTTSSSIEPAPSAPLERTTRARSAPMRCLSRSADATSSSSTPRSSNSTLAMSSWRAPASRG